MLTDDEWRRAYAYLLERVSEVDNSSVTFELQQVTRMRFEDDLRPEEVQRRSRGRSKADRDESEGLLLSIEFPMEKREPEKLGRSERQDLDTVRNRAPMPREVFLASIDVLNARLRELPAIATRLEELLERPSERLQWLPDAGQDEFASLQETFGATGFALDEDERVSIESALRRLEELLNEER